MSTWKIKLSDIEKAICLKTVSPKAIYAIVQDAILTKQSISVVRMGDGERMILKAGKNKPFTGCNHIRRGWNKKIGIDGMPTRILQKDIIDAGNTCTYFAPSISGVFSAHYYLYDFFKQRSHYFDNFYVNNWNARMIKTLFEISDGVFIIHRNYKKIIQNFKNNYKLGERSGIKFAGFKKDNWRDNEQAIDAAINSGMQLILYSGGPAGKIIGPKIAEAKNKIVLDIGNTLMPWSKHSFKKL